MPALGLLVGCVTEKEVGQLEQRELVNLVESEMVAVSAGTFDMGTEGGTSDEAPIHTVTLTHDFRIGRTEVTQLLWNAVMGTWDFEHPACDSCPAENLSWGDAGTFLNSLSDAAGLDQCDSVGGVVCPGYRFPTEAEWEFVARAGEGTEYAGSDNAADVAWTSENSGGESHEVCTTMEAENAWGLCDMSGNVWEWTNDAYDPEYYAESPSSDPDGPEGGSFQVSRGGGWSYPPTDARVANRFGLQSSNRLADLGLRVVRSAVAP